MACSPSPREVQPWGHTARAPHPHMGTCSAQSRHPGICHASWGITVTEDVHQTPSHTSTRCVLWLPITNLHECTHVRTHRAAVPAHTAPARLATLRHSQEQPQAWQGPRESQRPQPAHHSQPLLALCPPLCKLAGAWPNHLSGSPGSPYSGLGRGPGFPVLQHQIIGGLSTSLLGSPPCLGVCPALGEAGELL